MDQDRKQQILAAEAAFTRKDRLAKALAENGIYVVGKLTAPAPADEIERRPFPDAPPSGAEEP